MKTRDLLLGAAFGAALCIDGYGCSAPAQWERPPIELAPEDDLIDATQEWAYRWEEATGIHVGISPAGIPVKATPRAEDQNIEGAAESCAVTVHWVTWDTNAAVQSWTTRFVHVYTDVPDCPGMGVALGHEIGHVIGGPSVEHAPAGDYTDVFEPHLSPGISPAIKEASVSAVCAQAECARFAPER